jgi:PAS domain-containing protein
MVMNRTSATERQLAGKEARQIEAGLIETQRLLQVGYWEWNLETKKYGWCDEMYRIFNLKPQQFPLRTGTFFNRVHREDRRKVVKALGKALVGMQPYDIEHRILWPDGSVRFVHGKAEVNFDEAGRPISIWGSLQDITDRREGRDL